MKRIPVKQIVEEFHLEVLAGADYLDRVIQSVDIHRPGLEFIGFLTHFPKERIQLLGRTEISYLTSLPLPERDTCIREVVAQSPPCFIVTRAQTHVQLFSKYCDEYQIPLLRTTTKSTPFISLLHSYLERELANEEYVHGVCMNIFGLGVVLKGVSGIGKSEVALALIERGHRLVSDDIVRIKEIEPQTLVGTHNINNRELLHLRGIGFIDVTRLFGSGAFQDETVLDMEIGLIHWDDHVNSDLVSLGSDEAQVEYLGVQIPRVEIPVKPGRDITLLIEVACKNLRLKREGFDALELFQERLSKSTQGPTTRV